MYKLEGNECKMKSLKIGKEDHFVVRDIESLFIKVLIMLFNCIQIR